VRLFTEPIGVLLLDLPEAGLDEHEVAAAIDREFGAAIRSRLAAGPTPDRSLYLAGRRRALADPPPITVVVCTRDRPDALERCLDSLLAQAYPAFRILVVDNAPATGTTVDVVRAAALRGPVGYTVEPRPGLSHARNRALVEAPGCVLAWIHDDAVADPHWLAEIARGFHERPEADVVCGPVLPAELATPAQLWADQLNGEHPDRFAPATVTAAGHNPLYPLPALGSGANMAVRPGVLEALGGFDTALGPGTPATGGEDALLLARVLLGGGTIVRQPGALVSRYHRRGEEALRDRLATSGRALTAGYTALALRGPRLMFRVAWLAPRLLWDLLGRGVPRGVRLPADFPRDLLPAHRLGRLRGPAAYLRGKRRHPARHRAR
jgi:glycosyltransferase involved in cell wall biosynthesis